MARAMSRKATAPDQVTNACDIVPELGLYFPKAILAHDNDMTQIVVWVWSTGVRNAPVDALCAWDTGTVEHPTILGQGVSEEVGGAMSNKPISVHAKLGIFGCIRG